MSDYNEFDFEDDDTGDSSGSMDGFDGGYDDSFSDDYDDFQDDDFQDDDSGEETNRTFWIIAGILGALLVLALVCMVVYAMVLMPQRRDAQSTQVAEINMQNTSIALAAEMTAQAQAWTQTPTITNTPLPASPTPSKTPVVAPTNTPISGTGVATQDPRTATVAALLTQQAGTLTAVAPTPTIPNTGFADDFGIPGLLALAGALIVVIFLARRLRSSG
jgi:hypothetical protein